MERTLPICERARSATADPSFESAGARIALRHAVPVLWNCAWLQRSQRPQVNSGLRQPEWDLSYVKRKPTTLKHEVRMEKAFVVASAFGDDLVT